MRINETDIETIKNKVNIVDVISKYVSLVKKGKSHIGLCPFHNDTNPSMHVSSEKQIYKCFSCGEGGNVFTFIQQIENLPYPKAILKVADFIGYDMSKYKQSENIKKDEKKERLLDLLKNASEFYNFCLLSEDGIEGKNYLANRDIDEDLINKFKLGYAPGDSSKIVMFLTRKGYTVEEIIEVGLGYISEGSFTDRFNDRVIFPLTDLNGFTVAFSGRRIKNKEVAKYVNSSETKIFRKSECLYNFHESKRAVKKEGRIYLVEGFMDVIALSKVRIDNSVAIMGTSLSNNHLKALSSLNAEIIISFDGDDAGQNATYKLAKELLRNKNIKAKVTKVNKDLKDIDDILKEKGKDSLLKYLNNTYSLYEFVFYYMLKRVNLNNHSDKSKFIKDFSTFLNNYVFDKVELDHFINLLSEKTNTDISLIKGYVDKFKKNVVQSGVTQKKKTALKSDRYYKAEQEIIKQMLNHNIAIDYYINYLNVFYDAIHRKIALYLTNAYNSNIEIENLIIDLQEKDEKIYQAIIKIKEDRTMPSEFNKEVYDVVKYQKPLQMEIDELEEKLKQPLEKVEQAKIAIEKTSKVRKLKDLRNKHSTKKEE